MNEFPKQFLWGAATSAYQIEGSPLADGAGPSNWHRFSHQAGRIQGGDTGDVACDHYRRWRDDVDIMSGLGLNAYRLSLSWSRILPAGIGTINERGLDFYRSLIDVLLQRGIEPFVTLFHWDYPALLDDRGGWQNPDSASWFAEYARVVVRALGDRVRYWTTMNEPWVVVDAGYLHGVHAPGVRDVRLAPWISLRLLRAHAEGVRVLRSEGAECVGLVVNLEPKDPASASPEDLAAVRRSDVYMNQQYLDAVMFGRYPDGMREVFGDAWPRFSESDLEGVSEPLDFLGVNYYQRSVVRHDETALPPQAAPVHSPDKEYSDLGWEVYPEGLTRTLLWVKERYGNIPLFVTENGMALPEPATLDDPRLDDPRRISYLQSHITAVLKAIEQGADVRGYFVWSLLDNFEWACGRSKRFGIVHVDQETQRRTLKSSAAFYRDVIRTGGSTRSGQADQGNR